MRVWWLFLDVFKSRMETCDLTHSEAVEPGVRRASDLEDVR